MDSHKEIVSSGHSEATVHVNSQQSWQYSQDVCISKAKHMSGYGEELSQKFYP